MISICTATYNQEQFLDDYYNGIISQLGNNGKVLGHDVEVCIVDDCSKDNTMHRLLNYDWHRVKLKYHLNIQNEGGPSSLTTAIKMATGEYIALLDGDDYYKPEKLAKSLQFMLDNNLDAVSTEISAILPDDRWIERGWENINRNIGIKSMDFDYILNSNNIYTCTFMAKTECIKRAPSPLKLSKSFRFLGDFPLFLWIAKQGYKIGYLDEALSVFREGLGVNTHYKAESAMLYDKVKEWAKNGAKVEDLE